MRKTFLISVATAALIGTSGFAAAQAPSNTPNAPASQSGPTEKAAPAEKAAPRNRTEAPDAKVKSENGMKGSQADQKMPSDKGSVQRAQDNAKDDMKSKGASSEPKSDMKTGGKAASEINGDKSKTDSRNTPDTKSGATTGQAGAGSKQLTTEQRTTIRTVIKEQNVKPVTNVNFSISVGTRVPRTVTFHSVPTQLVTIYPDWRGYKYFLVGDQIVVVNPRTLEIVAVLEA
jgi:hypothetical protein